MIEFRLDKESFVPFYRQIIDMILAGISSGTLLPGERLPTIRDLAVTLGINPNTVVKAYSQLGVLGVLDMQQGSGVYVRTPAAKPTLSPTEESHRLEAVCRDFAARAQMMNISVEQLIDGMKKIRRNDEA